MTDTSPLLNLWQGFGVKPVQGDWRLMQSHIHTILASNNAIHASYITRWLAWAVQNPSKRAEVMLILKSEEEGSGKGVLANSMVEIFGMGIHGVRIDKPKQLTGDFNAHLQRASLVYVDEGHWPGNKADEGAYKGIITEPYFAVQPKGIDIYFVPNCSHIICTSNNDWVAPAGPTARRLAIFRVSPQRVGDRAYFKALFDQMENGGREAMLYDLLNMELGDWHPRNDIPQTEELMEQKLRSNDSELAWFIDLLDAGRLPGSGNKYLSLNECPAEWIFDAYTQHAGKTGKYHKSVQTMLGIKLRKWLKDCKPYLRNREGSYPRGEDGGTKRGTIYQFPPLDECRKAIGKHLNGSIPWHGPEEWVPSMEEDEEYEEQQRAQRDASYEEAKQRMGDEDMPF
ncbi:primase-helicase family protein [Mesorhizobium sp. CN2-181]|uniref:primase-helicase family protein n=1 Tax=Mesorhizobium yinganensis TaxID=3157707 RepID=UPI0032B7F992